MRTPPLAPPPLFLPLLPAPRDRRALLCHTLALLAGDEAASDRAILGYLGQLWPPESAVGALLARRGAAARAFVAWVRRYRLLPPEDRARLRRLVLDAPQLAVEVAA